MEYRINKSDQENFQELFDVNFIGLSTEDYDALNNAQKEDILERSYTVTNDGKTIAVVTILKEISDRAVIISYASFEEFFESETVRAVINTVVQELGRKYDSIYLRAEGSNPALVDACNRIRLEQAGKLRKTLFKEGKYWDFFIYKL